MERLIINFNKLKNFAIKILIMHLLPISLVTLVLPMTILSYIVSNKIKTTFRYNTEILSSALLLKEKVNDLFPMLLIQDDATKAILINPMMLESFSNKKIEAYDKHQKVLSEVFDISNDEDIRNIIKELKRIDTEKLRPIDTKILETVFEDIEAARKIYFDTYLKERDEYEKLIKTLYLAAMKKSDFLIHDLELENLSVTKSIQLIELLGLLGLSLIIFVLARIIKGVQENINILLSSLQEGLFYFNKNGQISAERATATEKIVPGSNKTNDLVSFFELISVDTKNIPVTLTLLWAKQEEGFFSDFSTTISMLPKRAKFIVDGKERDVKFDYRPQFKENQLDRVVLVVSDITEKLKFEKDAVVQNERVRKLAKAAANTKSLIDFSEEIKDLIKVASDYFSVPEFRKKSTALKRSLHTLKGTLAIFEFSTLSNQIHSLETMLDEAELDLSDQKIVEFWEQFKQKWQSEFTDIAQILGIEWQRTRLVLSLDVYNAHFELANKDKNIPLVKMLTSIRCLPVKEIFSKYEEYLNKICERQGEKSVCLVYEENSDNLAFDEIKKIDGSLVHIFSNCVVHGLENMEVRKKLGKNSRGSIKIGVLRKKDGYILLSIEDDGAGVNEEKLAAIAVENKIWSQEVANSATSEDKVNLVFFSGLSTSEKVSETSGRGVGMDAVKVTIESLGGTIGISSKRGFGTKFTILLPSTFPWNLIA